MGGSVNDQVVIREAGPADAGAIATVQVATWRTTYPGIIAQEAIDRLTVADREVALGRALRREIRFVPEAFVAIRAGRIFGFISGGEIREPIAGFDAELYAIYLLKTEQRAGVGAALTRHLARRLIEIGRRSMIVRVLTANPACVFYERLGGELVAEGMHMVFGVPYPERVYGYRDLHQLVGKEPV
jgi:GNAT superfamily N-acetyltransferase